MTATWLLCGKVRFVADPSGALVWPAAGTVVVADLHFEKGSAFAVRGALLPPYDTRATLARLEAVLRRWRPRRVISLGDGFHDARGAARLSAADRARLGAMIEAHEWLWVLGNHDPTPPAGLGGRTADAVELAGVVLRHRPEADPQGPEVAGHLHPKASVSVRGHRLSRPCFVGDRRRLVLPAFGAYTGGLDVRDPAIGGLFPEPPAIHLLGRRRVYTFGNGITGRD